MANSEFFNKKTLERLVLTRKARVKKNLLGLDSSSERVFDIESRVVSLMDPLGYAGVRSPDHFYVSDKGKVYQRVKTQDKKLRDCLTKENLKYGYGPGYLIPVKKSNIAEIIDFCATHRAYKGTLISIIKYHKEYHWWSF
ncbi:hypothetical protein HZA97_08960 [Candidatus Woesearchaeota archaeon]|nr:hypothetical protein [Candidatus Woesearchaeota archaeon]